MASVTTEGRAEFVAWAKAAGHRLAGAELERGLDDLVPLAAMVGDARVVGVGESWHPVHEFLSVQHRVARFLIERMGFRAVLLEASLASARRFDDFVQGGPRDAGPTSMVLDNEETERFLNWLRDYNAGLPEHDRVRVLGLDIHILIMENLGAPATTPTQVLDYLHRVDPDYSPPHLATARQVFDDVAFGPDRRMASFGFFEALDASTRRDLWTCFNDVVARLSTRQAAYRHASSPEDHAWALHRARVILQAHQMYQANTSSLAHGLAVRAEAMAENVQWALDHTGARAVILATGVHLARAPWRYAGDDLAIPSIGMRLGGWHGRDYVAIGTTFGTGRFDPPNPITGTTDLPAGAPNSLDLALAELGSGQLLLDLRDAPPGWTSEPRPLRPMQNVAAPPAYRLGVDLDLVVHVDRISGARVLRK